MLWCCWGVFLRGGTDVDIGCQAGSFAHHAPLASTTLKVRTPALHGALRSARTVRCPRARVARARRVAARRTRVCGVRCPPQQLCTHSWLSRLSSSAPWASPLLAGRCCWPVWRPCRCARSQRRETSDSEAAPGCLLQTRQRTRAPRSRPLLLGSALDTHVSAAPAGANLREWSARGAASLGRRAFFERHTPRGTAPQRRLAGQSPASRPARAYRISSAIRLPLHKRVRGPGGVQRVVGSLIAHTCPGSRLAAGAAPKPAGGRRARALLPYVARIRFSAPVGARGTARGTTCLEFGTHASGASLARLKR